MEHDYLIEELDRTIEEFNAAVQHYIDLMNKMPEDADDDFVNKVNGMIKGHIPPVNKLEEFLFKYYKNES